MVLGKYPGLSKKKPPEEERGGVGVLERPPEVPKAQPEAPPAIPLKGIDFTVPGPSLPAGYGKDATVKIMPDFGFVGTTPKLRSNDYMVFYEGKKVGSVKADTGTLEMDDPGFWWKAWVPSLKDRLYLSQSGQVPAEAFSKTPLKVQQQVSDWLYTPKKIGKTDIPAPATILSTIGLIGIGVITGAAALSQFNLLLQAKLPAVGRHLPWAKPTAIPKPTKAELAQFAELDAQAGKLAAEQMEAVLKANPQLAAGATPQLTSEITGNMANILKSGPQFGLTRGPLYGLTGPISGEALGSPYSMGLARSYARFALEWAMPAKSPIVVNLLTTAGYATEAIAKMSIETAWGSLVNNLGIVGAATALVNAYEPSAITPPVTPVTPEVTLPDAFIKATEADILRMESQLANQRLAVEKARKTFEQVVPPEAKLKVAKTGSETLETLVDIDKVTPSMVEAAETLRSELRTWVELDNAVTGIKKFLAEAKAYRVAIPKAELGMPEAGYQPAMIEGVTEKEVRPKGKGIVTQISMEEQLKLQQTMEGYEAQAEIGGLQANLDIDPIAQARFRLGNRNVGLDAFISIREGAFPDYFTVKQAEALMPGHTFTNLTKEGKVPRDAALDDLTKQFNMTPDEIADRVMAIRSEKAMIKSLETEAMEPTELPAIPVELPTIPPPLPPEAVTLGRTENEWTGFMADLQEAQTVADVAFRNDAVRRWINLLPEIKGFFKVMNPSAIANTPAEQSIIIRAVLRDEGYQKTQGVIAFLNELGSQEKIFGGLDEKGLIKSGILKGKTVGDIAEHRSQYKLTDEQKMWLDRAKVIEDSIIEFLEKNGIDITLLRLEEGGQFATRRVWGRTLKDGSVIDTAYVGAGPGRPGARLPTEKHRMFATEAEAIKAGYRYLPYEEALYLKLSGAYNRVADKQMADWLLSKVPWRTTGAPEELKLAAEAARLKYNHSKQLLSALNRAVRGERVPDVTIRAIASAYPDQAQRLKDLIPRIQAGEPTAREVQDLTRVAKGLISSDKSASQRAINARARARERALVTKMGEAIIPAPAFAGKILTGPEAKETANALRRAFDPSFSKALGQINKVNAVSRYFMLAGDFSPFAIQLLFLAGENPILYGKTFTGAMRALFNPDFHSGYLTKHKATIDKHPNLVITKAGATEFTEAMARGGWLSGKTALIPDAENYWKTLGLFLPRVMGKVGATVLTPFQRVFESSLDIAGIEMAEAYDYMCTTPARTADVDQFINEFRGLTSSARIGVDVLQRQIETGIILAPRYNRAIAGLLYDVGTGGIRGSLARKALAKGIAALCAIAALVSIARGESQEEIIDHYNPNSANFFTWDVAGQKVGPGTKVRSVIKLFAQSVDNPDSLFELSMDNPGLRFLRVNLSPVVGTGLDLITGRSYIGDPTRDGMLSFSKEVIGGNLLPIWVQTVLMEGGDIKSRTARGIAEFFGGRAYPEPVWGEVGKLRDKYAKQDFNIKYEELNRMQTDKLRNNHPDLKDLEDKAGLEGAERGTEFEKWVYNTREQIVSERNDALEKAAVALNSGLMSKYDYDKERGYARPYYSGGMSVLWLARESLDTYSIKQIEKWMGENQKPEDKALDDYQEYRGNLIQKADLPKDWDDIEAKSEAYLSRYSRSIQDYVEANLSRWINDLPENARNVELMRMAGIEDETWWDDYRGTAKRKPITPSKPTTPSGGGVLGEYPGLKR